MIYRELSAVETLPLRSAVLRSGKPLAECVFDGGDAPLTRHFGAVDATGNVVEVVSVYRQDHPAIAGNQLFQLRGMAIDPVCQGQGVGQALLPWAEQYAKSCGSTLIWANARSSALGFYRNQDYQVVSEEFEITGVGPHFRVSKAL